MKPLFLRERVLDAERLDGAVHSPNELRLNLTHLAGVSRWLGGERSIVPYVIAPLSEAVRRPVTVLDVGAGDADLPRRLVGKIAPPCAGDVMVVAMDRLVPVAAIAAERSARTPSIRVLAGDGLRIPLRDKCVDLAYSSTTLHHLGDGQAVQFVKELKRVATRAVVIGDLERNVLALIGAHILVHTWWRRSPYRHDGPLSVRRAFTQAELLRVGRLAGLIDPVVYRHFPFRLTLVGRVR